MSKEQKYINITDDKGLKKRIINEGKGDQPIDGSRVRINYIEKRFEKNKLKISKKIKSIFNIGTKRVIKGWEIGIKTMKLGEKSEFIMNPKYSNIKFLKPKESPDIIYEIELLEIEKPATKFSEYINKKDLSLDKINKGEQLKKIKYGNFEKTKTKNIVNQNNLKSFKKEKISKSLDKYKTNRIYGNKYYKIIKMKSDSPICDKCFRFIYISFDFIKNYISTKCSYCNKFDIYTYDTFYEKIKIGENPLLKSCCHKCKNNFMLSEDSFYLFEDADYNFIILCQNCLIKTETREYKKKIKLNYLIEHNLSIYEKNKNLDTIKNLETKFSNNKKNILLNVEIFKKYEKDLLIIESIIKNNQFSPLSKNAEDKLNNLKKELKIKKKIIESFKQYNNFILGNNILSLISNLLNIDSLNLSNKKIYNMKESYEIIKYFLECENYLKIENLNNSFKFFDDFIITKTSNNNFKFHDKNEPKSEIFDLSYLNVININFDTQETIVYNILADYCFAEKITPIQFIII